MKGIETYDPANYLPIERYVWPQLCTSPAVGDEPVPGSHADFAPSDAWRHSSASR